MNYKTWPLLPPDCACTSERRTGGQKGDRWILGAHMKTITRSNIYLPMAAMILTAVLAVPAGAQQQVPFKGTIQQGQDVDIPGGPPPITVVVAASGTGTGTHMGQFSFTQITTVNFANNTSAGSGHWIAANGDSIYTTVFGAHAEMVAPDVISITEINTITGGTGRFAGAQGSFTVVRLANVVTLAFSGSFLGTITSPGATH
jgi:hypothetical protein